LKTKQSDEEISRIVRKKYDDFLKKPGLQNILKIAKENDDYFVECFFESVFNVINCSYQFNGDHGSFKGMVYELCSDYIKTPRLHCNSITCFLSCEILRSEYVPLKREGTYFLSGLPSSYMKLSDPGAHYVIIVLIFVALLYFSAPSGYIYMFLAAVGLRLFHMFRYNMKYIRKLELILEEVCSWRFDSEEIIARLKKLEDNGLYVHSLTYPILRLK